MRCPRRHIVSLGRRPWPLLGLTALVAACAPPPPPDGPSVLLITVDTLRADHVGAYRPETTDASPSLTPRIDELASQGVLFENAAATMALTRPSHFSMLTSQYPRQHGVVNNQIALPDAAVTLPEIFATRGYRTGGFMAVSLLDEASGAAQGFDTFHHPTLPRERPAAEVVDEALGWVETLEGDQPFFAWVHLFDPHLPYNPPASHRSGLDAELNQRWPRLHWKELFEIANANDGDVPAAILDHARALYRNEVGYVDSQIGVLFDGLASCDRLDDTLIVFTADHGESFENGIFFEHGDSLFDGAIRVPLIVIPARGLEGWPAPGTRIREQVSVIDIAPTLLAAAGFDIPDNTSGKPLQYAARFGDRYVLVQHPFFRQTDVVDRPQLHSVIRTVGGQAVSDRLAAEQVGLVGVEWKLLRTGETSSLYNRAADPREVTDLANKETAIREELEAVLEQQLEAYPLSLIDPGQINDELRETLEALGYLN